MPDARRGLVLSLMATCLACSGTGRPRCDLRATSLEAVRAVDDEVLAAMGSGDWSAYHDHMSDDIVWMVPNGRSLRGWEEIGPYLAEFGAVRSLDWSNRDIVGSGTLAIRTLDFVMRTGTPDPAVEVRYAGKMLSVYRKESDGRWSVTAEIWNSSPSDSAPDTSSPGRNGHDPAVEPAQHG